MSKYKHEYIVSNTGGKKSKKASIALDKCIFISLITGYGDARLGAKIKMKMPDGSMEIIRIQDRNHDCGFIAHAILRLRELARAR